MLTGVENSPIRFIGINTGMGLNSSMKYFPNPPLNLKFMIRKNTRIAHPKVTFTSPVGLNSPTRQISEENALRPMMAAMKGPHWAK